MDLPIECLINRLLPDICYGVRNIAVSRVSRWARNGWLRFGQGMLLIGTTFQKYFFRLIDLIQIQSIN